MILGAHSQEPVDALLQLMTDEQLATAKAQIRESLQWARVFKAADVFLGVDEDLHDAILHKWDAKAKVQIEKGAKVLAKAQKKEVVQSTLKGTLWKLGKVMGAEYGEDVLPDFMRATLLTWSLASKETMGRLQLKWSTELVDQKAAARLSKYHTYWVGRHYGASISESLQLATQKTIIEGGLAGTQAANAYRDIASKYLAGKGESFPEVPLRWTGTTDEYFAGLSNHVGTQARVFSRLESYERVGITTYRVVAVLDDRTSDICQMMHGQTFTVQQGLDVAEVWSSEYSPEDVKEKAGWLRVNEAAKLAGLKDYKPGTVSPKISPKGMDALAKAGMALPPYHFRCRTDIVAEQEVTTWPTGGEPTYKPVKPPKAQPPKPPPAAPTPPAKAPGGFPWAMSDLSPVQKSAKGMHTKEFFRDPDGNEWMFKPAPEGLRFRAEVEKLAADAARALGVDTADVYMVTHKGKTGTIQRLFKGVQHDGLTKVSTQGLTQEQVAQLQRQHIFDWLIGNNDGHIDNFLILKDGRLVGIDRGQAFRYFKTDKLALDYNPNARYGIKVFYNDVFAAARDGKLPKGVELLGLDSPEIAGLVKKAETLSDDQWLAIWKPYIDGAMKNKSLAFGSRKAFERELLRRKNQLGKDLDGFYRKILGKGREANRAAQTQKGALTPVNKTFVKEMQAAKNRGKAVLIASEEVENGNVLVYSYKDGTVVVEGKIRKLADSIVRQQLGGTKVAAAPDLGLGTEEIWNSVLKSVKSFNFHLGPNGDGKIPASTQVVFKRALRTLAKMMKSPNPDQAAAARYYRSVLLKYGNVQEGMITSRKATLLGKKVKPYKPKATPIPKGTPGASSRVKTARITKIQEEERVLKKGVIDNEHGKLTSAPYQDMDETKEMIVAVLEDGTEIHYVPHDGYKQGQAYSKQGRFRIKVQPKAGAQPTPEQVQQALDAIGDLGVAPRLMTEADFELLYLRKNQFAMGWAKDKAFANIPSNASTQEKIDALLKAFEKKLKKNPRALPGYNPRPVYYSGDNAGIPRFQRFDINPKTLAKANLEFNHQVHGQVDETLLRILDGETGGLISTEEKLRRGIPLGGMSPGTDQATGGAQFVFTRAREVGDRYRNSIILKKDLALDTNMVSYAGDKFGTMKPDTKERLRAKTLRKLLSFRGKGSNESLIKNEIPIDMWEHIVVSNDKRTRLLKELEKRGVKKLAGKPVEEFVIGR